MNRVDGRRARARRIDVNGVSMTAAEIAELTGEHVTSVLARVRRGGPPLGRARGAPRPKGTRDVSSPKSCESCGQPFTRRPDEPASNYVRRRTCSPSCKNALVSALRSDIDREEFVRAWNTATSVDEVAERFGIDNRSAYKRAQNMRTEGRPMKRMRRRGQVINVHGMKLTVREFCELTGEPVNTVLYRLRRGISPFGPRTGRQGRRPIRATPPLPNTT